MNIEAKANINTVGTFEVETDALGNLKADAVSFEETDTNFNVWVAQGLGGVMEPKKFLQFIFPRKTTIEHYAIKDLVEVKLRDYSEMHSFEYVPLAGWVTVWLTESPRRVRGIFSMDMKNIGESSGPSTLKATGSFDLSNG